MELADSDYAEPEQQNPTIAVGINGSPCPSPSSSESLFPEPLSVVRSFHGELPQPSGAPAEVPGDSGSTTCASCGGSEIGAGLVVCDGCERGFHLECSEIHESEPVISEWLCKECLSNGVPVNRWPLGPKSNSPGHGGKRLRSDDLHGGGGEGKDSKILRKHSPDDNIFCCNLFGGSVTYSDSWHVENLGFEKDPKVDTTENLGFEKDPEVDTPAAKLISKDIFHSSDSANLSFEEEDIRYLIGKLRCTSHTIVRQPSSNMQLQETKLRASGKDMIQLFDKPVMESPRLPPGRLLFSELPSDLVGDVLQVWEFLNRFHVVLGIGPPLSIEELEEGLRCPIFDGSDIMQQNGDSLQGANGEAICTRTESFSNSRRADIALIKVQCSLLRVLMGELQLKVAAIVHRNIDTGKLNKQKGKKTDVEISFSKDTYLNMPINEFTWPYLAWRCTLAMLSMDRSCGSPKVSIDHSGNMFCCLAGDGPNARMLCGSLTGVVGMEADASLLAQALRKIYGHLDREHDMLFIADEDPNISGDCRSINSSNGNLPKWVELLQPVRSLPTNVGARIRNCVRNALKEGPPDWAKVKLENSISKEVYKGNASGPTKRAVIEVLTVACGQEKQQESYKGKKKNYARVSDLIMKKCRLALRVAATDINAKFFYNLRWGQILSCNKDGLVNLGAPVVASRPLDFRTIDMKLAVGAYDGSHEAFLEDVHELWSHIRAAYDGQPDLIWLADKLSSDFETLYQKEVLRLRQKLVGYAKLGCLTATSKQEVDGILDCSSKLPKAPWRNGVCKVCGVDEHDGSVLLCDGRGCNDEYHTYCLNPPLAKIPKGLWFCSSCTAKNGSTNDALECAEVISPVQRKCQEDVIRLASALEGKEYCQLGIKERTWLLKFLCDELLDSDTLRKHITNCEEPSAILQQQSSFNPTELRNLKNHVTPTTNVPKTGKHPSFDILEGKCSGVGLLTESLDAGNQYNDIQSLLEGTQSSGSFSRHIELSLRRELLGRDSTGRLYWILGRQGIYQGIIVSSGEKDKKEEEKEITFDSEASCDSESPTWLSYQSGEDVIQLMEYLRDDDPLERKLKDSILQLNLTFEDFKPYEKEGKRERAFSGSENRETQLNSLPLDTKAFSFLNNEFGPWYVPESVNVLKMRERRAKQCAEQYLFRCSCLELVWTSRHHCLLCHRTFSTAAKLEGHNDSLCRLAPPVSKKKKETIVPKVKELMGSGDAGVKCTSEIAIFQASQSGYLHPESSNQKSQNDVLKCPPDWEEIRARFVTNDSNRELVQEIGCIRSKKVEFIDSKSSYLNDPNLILPAHLRGVTSGLSLQRNAISEPHTAPGPVLEKNDIIAPCLRPEDLGTEKFHTIPKAAVEPVVGKAAEILNKLKVSLLDMDAALPEAALRPSKANVERRWAWRAFVKSAKSIYEVVQAIVALEDSIRSDYLMNGASYCSSVSGACSISSVTALALRIGLLDASICYGKKPDEEKMDGLEKKLKSVENKLKRKRGVQKKNEEEDQAKQQRT